MLMCAKFVALCAFLLITSTRDAFGRDCPSPSSPSVVSTASGTITIAPDRYNANCAWRIEAPSGTVSMTLSGYQNHATDIITLYDGYDDTARQIFTTSFISSGTISIQQRSTQRYVYVTYESTSSYGNYSLAYTSSSGTGNINNSGNSTGNSGGTMHHMSSADGFKWVISLLLLTIIQRTVIAQFNNAKLA